MVYLKLDESNQIVTATSEDYQLETMDCQYSTVWVEDGEIKIWGCADVAGFIDSTQFYHPELNLGASNELDEAQTTSAESSAIAHLKSLGKKVYKDDVEQ